MMFKPFNDMMSSMDSGVPGPVSGPSNTNRDRTSEVENLRMDVERLLIITEALWSILREQHGFDDNEMIKRMALIDMKDGRVDGKVAATPPQPCPHCHRPLAKKRPRCFYCGQLVPVDPFSR